MSNNGSGDGFGAGVMVPPGINTTTTEPTPTPQQHQNGNQSASSPGEPAPAPVSSHEAAPVPTTPQATGKEPTAPPTTDPEPAEKRVIPTMGFPGFMYRFTGGRWILPLSAREVAVNKREAEAALRKQIQDDLDTYQGLLEDAVVRETQQEEQTDTVANVKGGASKTPVACNYATVKGGVTRRVTTVVDNNPNWGTTALLLGIDPRQTVTVRVMNESLTKEQVTNFAEFSAPLGSNRFSVQLIASDEISYRETYGYKVAHKVISAAKTNSINVVVDTGNEISDSAMKATLELSDILIVAALTTFETIAGAVHTMHNFARWDHNRLVRHSIVVVSALQPGDSAENYRQMLQLNADHVLIGIPYDDRISKYLPVDLRLMPQQTYIAYLELVLAAARVKKHVDANGAEATPLLIKQGAMVPLPSGRTPVLSYITQEASTSASPKE